MCQAGMICSRQRKLPDAVLPGLGVYPQEEPVDGADANRNLILRRPGQRRIYDIDVTEVQRTP